MRIVASGVVAKALVAKTVVASSWVRCLVSRPMATLTLYSTSGCHLCERALELLRSMPELARHTVIEVDVALDAAALARYGARIPVIAFRSGVEIDWPFNADDVVAALDRAR